MKSCNDQGLVHRARGLGKGQRKGEGRGGEERGGENLPWCIGAKVSRWVQATPVKISGSSRSDVH